MLTKLKKALGALANLTSFARPYFACLRYEHIVIKERSYLLITWTSVHAFKFSIKALRYNSYHTQGSAYIISPDNTPFVQIRLSNLWRSRRVNIKLTGAGLDRQIDYHPVKKSRKLIAEKIYRPEPKNKVKTPVIQRPITTAKAMNFRFNLKNLQQ